MDLRQLEYIAKIAEFSNITLAAEQLYISQSGLNQQLLKVEKELGIPLFHRGKNNLCLTAAGEIYVEYASDILKMKREAYDKIYDLVNDACGTLSLGLTPERGIPMLLGVYPDFKKKFPKVVITPAEIQVKKQISMLVKHELDLGFVTLSANTNINNLVLIPLKSEPILLGISRSHPLARYANAPYKPYAEIGLSLFKNEQFVLIFKESSMRDIINPLFKDAGFAPQITFEATTNKILVTMTKNKIGCTLVPETYAEFQEDVAYFLLPTRPEWQFFIAYNKGHYLSKAMKYFIEQAIKYWENLEISDNKDILL